MKKSSRKPKTTHPLPYVPFVMFDDARALNSAEEHYRYLMSEIDRLTSDPTATKSVLELERATRRRLEKVMSRIYFRASRPKGSQKVHAIRAVASWYLFRLGQLASNNDVEAVKALAEAVVSGVRLLEKLERTNPAAVFMAKRVLLEWPVALRAGDGRDTPENLFTAHEEHYGVSVAANKWSTRPIPLMAHVAVWTMNMNRDVEPLTLAVDKANASPEWVRACFDLPPLDKGSAAAWGAVARRMIRQCCPNFYSKKKFSEQWRRAEANASGDVSELAENYVLNDVVSRIRTIARRAAMPEKSA